MLAGQQAFQGEDVSDTLASVIKADADLTSLPSNLNPRLFDLLRRSLAKNRRERWHAMGDVRLELEAIMVDPRGQMLRMGVPGVERLSWLKWIIAIAVTAILVAAATTVVVRKLQPAQSADIMRFSFVLPQDQGFSNPGRHVIAISQMEPASFTSPKC